MVEVEHAERLTPGAAMLIRKMQKMLTAEGSEFILFNVLQSSGGGTYMGGWWQLCICMCNKQ